MKEGRNERMITVPSFKILKTTGGTSRTVGLLLSCDFRGVKEGDGSEDLGPLWRFKVDI